MKKIKKIYHSLIFKIFTCLLLLICSIVLLIFPLKQSSTASINTSLDYNIIKLSPGDSVEQKFSISVDDLRNLTLTFKDEEGNKLEDSLGKKKYNNLKNGTLSVYIYCNDKEVIKSEIIIEQILNDPNWNIAFPDIKNSLGEDCKVVLTYENDIDVQFPLLVSESQRDTSYIEYNGQQYQENILINTYGRLADYFFAWYPLMCLLVIGVIFSLDIGREDR